MKHGSDSAAQGSTQDVGVLVANLGTPSEPSLCAVRKHLRQFLSDPRVVDAPRVMWWLVLNLVILPFRPRRSAALYQKIWTSEGSPLLVTTERIGRALALELKDDAGPPISVEVGMRYGSPSLESGLQKLTEAGCGRVLLLPLYPQYSGTTTGSTFDALFQAQKRLVEEPEVRTVQSYCEHRAYIEALATGIEARWAATPRSGRLLMSFHGLPQRYADAGDPYPQQCERTAELLAGRLGLDNSAWQMTYQSRFGREPWLEPATNSVLAELGGQGQAGLDVVCPGFAAECLETLEEIAIAGRKLYEEAGGTGFRYIPALNDRPEHIQALAEIAREHLEGWI